MTIVKTAQGGKVWNPGSSPAVTTNPRSKLARKLGAVIVVTIIAILVADIVFFLYLFAIVLFKLGF